MSQSTRRIFLKSVATAGAALALPNIARAQQWTVSTVAGNGVAGYEYEGSGGLAATRNLHQQPLWRGDRS